MRISLSTGSLYHRSLSFGLEVARAAGCDGVELVLGLGYTLRGLAPLERAIARHDVPVLSVHPPLRPLPGWPRDVRERARRVGETARQLGASVCVVHPGMYTSEASPRARRFAAALAMARDAAGEHASITLENNQFTGHSRRWLLDDLGTLVRYAGEHACGITLDTCHVGANGEDLLTSYERARPLLRNIHLSDMRWRDGQPQTHLLPGEGILPLKTFLARLASDGYAGLVTLELHPLELGLIGQRQAVRRVTEAVEYIRAAIAAPAGI